MPSAEGLYLVPVLSVWQDMAVAEHARQAAVVAQPCCLQSAMKMASSLLAQADLRQARCRRASLTMPVCAHAVP